MLLFTQPRHADTKRLMTEREELHQRAVEEMQERLHSANARNKQVQERAAANFNRLSGAGPTGLTSTSCRAGCAASTRACTHTPDRLPTPSLYTTCYTLCCRLLLSAHAARGGGHGAPGRPGQPG